MYLEKFIERFSDDLTNINDSLSKVLTSRIPRRHDYNHAGNVPLETKHLRKD